MLILNSIKLRIEIEKLQLWFVLHILILSTSVPTRRSMLGNQCPHLWLFKVIKEIQAHRPRWYLATPLSLFQLSPYWKNFAKYFYWIIIHCLNLVAELHCTMAQIEGSEGIKWQWQIWKFWVNFLRNILYESWVIRNNLDHMIYVENMSLTLVFKLQNALTWPIFELQKWFLPKNWSEFHQKFIGTVISDPRTAQCDIWWQF